MSEHPQPSHSEAKPYILETKLLRQPTPELVAMADRIKGLFNFRGSICEFFPQNTVATFLMLKIWKDFVSKNNLSPETVDKVIPPLYKNSICVLPKVKIQYFDKDTRTYNDYLIDGKQLEIENVLFRQGYNLPFALVTQGPYAGLLLSLPEEMRTNGYEPEDVTHLVIQRLMNDGDVGDKERQGKYSPMMVLALSDPTVDPEIKKKVQEKIFELPTEVINLYNQYNKQLHLAGADGKLSEAPVSSVEQIQKFCQEMGFPYNPDEVNYQMLS